MDDHELLEMAAKAVGFEVLPNIETLGEGVWIAAKYRSIFSDEHPEYLWNPLADDGDALRLAVRLCMSVSAGPCVASANTISGALRGVFPKEDTISQGQGRAVRRVIVIAAADIGRNMP